MKIKETSNGSDDIQNENALVPVSVGINRSKDLPDNGIEFPAEMNIKDMDCCSQANGRIHHNECNVRNTLNKSSSCKKNANTSITECQNISESFIERFQKDENKFNVPQVNRSFISQGTGIHSAFQITRELKNGSSPKVNHENSKDIQGHSNSNSVSVDKFQVSLTDEEKLLARDTNRLPNGKCATRSSILPINNENDDIRTKSLLVCHEEETDDFKVDSESPYLNRLRKASICCTAEGVNRIRKCSFMNIARNVPKPVQISSETKKETKLARISLCIVWLFIFCHIWKLIPTAYETFFTEDMGVGLNVEWPYWLTIMKEISHSLITINSSLNFLIYIVL